MISRRHSGKGASAAPKLPSGADGSPILTNRRPLRHRVPGQRPASCHSSVMRIGFDGSDHSPGRIRSAGHRMRQSDSVPCSYSCRSRFVAARALMIRITMQSTVQRFHHGSNDRSAVPPNELTRECSQPTEPDRRQPSYPRSARYRLIVASAAARSCSSSRSFRTASATSMRSSSSEVST